MAAQSSHIPFHKIDLLFAGDIMQHQKQLEMAAVGDNTYSFSKYYRHISMVIEDAGISIANLETPIGPNRFSGYPSFCAPDSFLYAAKNAGFDVMLLANNHCLDRGKSGALHTIALLDSLGIHHCGVYRNSQEREKRYPLLLEKEGIRIALLNYTYGTNGYSTPYPLVVNLIDKETISADITKAKEMKPDAIIACMHWGDEYVSLPPKEIKDLADWLLEQGVDHIIGNHPHVLQPIEIRDRDCSPDKNVVVYSTGNLVSNMSKRGTDGGMMVRMSLWKVLDNCWLSSLRYLLTWIAPENNNGARDFTILPAATTKAAGVAAHKLETFLNDSREMFHRYNKGEVYEFTTDSVKITP